MNVGAHLQQTLAFSTVQFWEPEHTDLSSDLYLSEQVRPAMRQASVVLLDFFPATASSSVVKTLLALAADYPRPGVLGLR
jgi:hypothetical protein